MKKIKRHVNVLFFDAMTALPARNGAAWTSKPICLSGADAPDHENPRPNREPTGLHLQNYEKEMVSANFCRKKISVRTQTASSVYAHYRDLWKIKLLMTLMVYIHDINDKNCFVEFTLNTFFIIVSGFVNIKLYGVTRIIKD